MPIDTSPSTVATNALQAIPFSSLIGGPLDACIKAQANSAMTSWQFINEVGLYTDPETGEKKAVQVMFQYNSNGQMTTLVVPLLTIVPIPYLAIDAVTIDFIANISASASNVVEESNDTDLNVNATAEASIGVGPFSLKISASANYSSKQHSKASQDSKYSVEYTMNVHVEGGQADMPQGLGTILNILQGSVTSNNTSDMLTVIPNRVYFNPNQSPNTSAQVQVTVKDAHGVVAPGVEVQANIIAYSGDSPFGSSTQAIRVEVKPEFNNTHPLRLSQKMAQKRFLTRAEQKAQKLQQKFVVDAKGNLLKEGSGATTAITDDKGQATFTFSLTNNLKPGSYSGIIEFDATINPPEGSLAKPQEYTNSINYIVIIPQPNTGNASLQANPNSVVFADTADQTVAITASNYPDDVDSITVNITSQGGMVAANTFTTDPANTITLSRADGFTKNVTLKIAQLATTEQTGLVTFTDANNNTSLTTVNVSVNKTP